MINNVAESRLSSIDTLDTEHFGINHFSLSLAKEIIESDLCRAKNVDWNEIRSGW